jgi:hypothetical protein
VVALRAKSLTTVHSLMPVKTSTVFGKLLSGLLLLTSPIPMAFYICFLVLTALYNSPARTCTSHLQPVVEQHAGQLVSKPGPHCALPCAKRAPDASDGSVCS